MTQAKTTTVAAEGGHWYLPSGEQVLSVPKAKGDGFRAPTLRDARKPENLWLPGCTAIIRMAAAPQLVRWQQERAVEAALELDQQDEEDSSAYMRRVISKAGEVASEAAAAGTEVHKAIELFYSGKPYDKAFRDHVMGATNAIEWACASTDGEVYPWIAEQSAAHSSGYACRVDLHSETWVLDIKTKAGTAEDWAGRSGRIGTYPNHWMQLAACRKALEERFLWKPDQQRCGIVYVSRDHAGVAELVEVKPQQLEQGWAMFQALLAYWKAANRYDPTEVQP